jgi:hypothetical protein
MKTKMLSLIILSLGTRLAGAQGFVDLNFESANLSAYGAGPAIVPASNAIPGWTATGNLSPSEIVYNTLSTGAPSVALLGNNGSFSALDGAYSIDLYGGSSGSPTGASISQTGLVPANAVSIQFIAQGAGSLGGPLSVSLGGQNISLFTISTGSSYSLYGGNIPSGLAGNSEQLILSASPDGGNNFWEIDDIRFSSSVVPEPGVAGLLGLGGLLLGLCRWKKIA